MRFEGSMNYKKHADVPIGHGAESDRLEGEGRKILSRINLVTGPEPIDNQLKNVTELRPARLTFSLQDELRDDIDHVVEHVPCVHDTESGHEVNGCWSTLLWCMYWISCIARRLQSSENQL